MNTTDNPQHNDPARPDPARLMPEVPRERAEAVEAASTPEAVRAAQVARDDKQNALVRGRGVEWVRPTDLIARHSAHAAGRGLDFQAELARRTRTPLGAGVRRLGGTVPGGCLRSRRSGAAAHRRRRHPAPGSR
ncbi:hypothetical protein [Kocuria sp. JC486]|uniref:hypothetical protein n=1 Tax=Kocuria sp. JC486 TaxID=1970736 RepID=UPI001FD79434|nr:hypothetical protein [Kocuria sp. JC486]